MNTNSERTVKVTSGSILLGTKKPAPAPMNASAASAERKVGGATVTAAAKTAPKKQPAPPESKPKAVEVEKDDEGDEVAEAAPKKPKAPKRFSIEASDIELTSKQEVVHLALEKAMLVYGRSAKGGIALKSAFMEKLGTNASDEDIDAIIKSTLYFNADNEDTKAGGEWTDASDIRRAFVKAFFNAK